MASSSDPFREHRSRSCEVKCLDAHVTQKNLVSDLDQLAPIQNPNAINLWGIVSDPCDLSLWVAANGSGQVLHLDASYHQISGFAVPGLSGNPGAPTGLVWNPTEGFQISGSFIGPAQLIVVTEDGLIAGYNPEINRSSAVVAVDNSGTSAVYKGATLFGGYLYVTNFRSGMVEKYDKTWKMVSSFTDSGLNASGYSPFNILGSTNNLYVTFAERNSEGHDDVAGIGNGYLDAFTPDGSKFKRILNRGPLNSPWGLQIDADLLYVGNFGDGRINIFNRLCGDWIGQLTNACGLPIIQDGLWGLLLTECPCLKVCCADRVCRREGSRSRSSGRDCNCSRCKVPSCRPGDQVIFTTSGPNGESHGLLTSLHWTR